MDESNKILLDCFDVKIRELCLNLIDKINIFKKEPFRLTPLARYIISIPCAIPVEHIILAERPYGTNIFPYAASAMSYDPNVQHKTTPIVHFLALDINNQVSDLDYNTVRDWFRDSWKYLNKGIIALNVCTTFKFMDNNSEKERVAMEEFIRDIISISLKVSDSKIHVYALGNPARHSASRIRSSVAEHKDRISIHQCKNPAGFKHKYGDTMSPEFTLNTKSVSKLLSKIIKSTVTDNNILTPEHYYNMSSGDADYTRLKERSISTTETFQSIANYFKTNTGKLVERNDEIFNRAAAEMQEFTTALSSARIALLFKSATEPQGTSKPAYLEYRSKYNKSQYSKGSSSKASVQTSGRKHNVGFGDVDILEESSAVTSETPSIIVNTPETPTPVRTPTKHTKSITEFSSATQKTHSIGFGDDDSDDDVKSDNTESFNVNMSTEELNDLAIIADFIDPSSDNYNIESAVQEFIQESIRSGKVENETTREVLKIIRDTHQNKSMRSISNALGIEDSIQDMPHPVMQWILRNAVS